ncbi:3-deoxy-manno-octulosonate cytidylyltransferase [uncultured Prochlorococcus sp.]|uniref:3-deoxy-manno-octulosonate cytidylyltransferase n=1 Tax=uncultured Prochlorococcus sp. TaxID=159733 RepID=UPI00258A9855|nr:3-deoxy-manno-octulosonate cytidylyltransferase [uncultured Prochlorococcus sp.]
MKEETIKTIIAIPGRLNSSRLPNKLIADINGKSMIQRVIEQCKEVNSSSELFLCTDSKMVAEIGKKLKVNILLTSENISSGSERIASVLNEILEKTWSVNLKDVDLNDKLEIYKNTFIVNVQGDQPFIDKKVIDKMINIFVNNNGINQVITPIYKLSKEAIFNENVVKLVLNHLKQVLYFSRSPIPFVRGIEEEKWHEKIDFWGHVGIYGYRADILRDWKKYKKSNLESIEKLEQLRLVESGIIFDTFLVEGDFLSVDTESQLFEAIEIAKRLD